MKLKHLIWVHYAALYRNRCVGVHQDWQCVSALPYPGKRRAERSMCAANGIALCSIAQVLVLQHATPVHGAGRTGVWGSV
jgi:hypothetical protein